MTESKCALAVTTSTGVTGVALGPTGPGRADDVVSQLVATDRRHAEELTPMIRHALGQAGATMDDVDLLVVDIGPGRFTGLRVGLATVRAMAFARDLPVVGLTSLEILAAAVEDDEPVTAVVDARRGEVFQQSFRSGPTPNALGPPVVGKAQALASAAVGITVGDGADLYRDVYESGDLGLVVRPGCNPDPVTMLGMAGDRTPLAGVQVEPLYLRDPDVNPNVKTRPVADRNQAPAGPKS